MEEKVFLSSGSTSVTSSKIVVGGNTYATRNVGSVRMVKVGAPDWPWLLGVFGLVLFKVDVFLAASVIAFSAYVLYNKRTKHQLMMMAGGGESMAVESTDIDQIKRVHDAIVEAISARQQRGCFW